jgi:hypothetical protein
MSLDNCEATLLESPPLLLSPQVTTEPLTEAENVLTRSNSGCKNLILPLLLYIYSDFNKGKKPNFESTLPNAYLAE